MNPTITRLDRFIGFFSPQSMLQRAKARHAASIYQDWVKRKYEGASRGPRTQGWLAPSTSAAGETAMGLDVLRNRSRDLRRNNPYAARAISIVAANTIGTGIVLNAKLRDAANRKPAEKKSLDQMLDKWAAWADTTAIDADGRLDFYGLQNLIMTGVAEGGEMLIRRRWREKKDGLPVPVQIQVLEPDFIDTRKDEILKNGNRVVQGVEYDFIGRRVAYWLFDEHPGDMKAMGLVSRRIPASDIRHVFRSERAGQVRGVPWLAPAIIRLRELDEYQDAQLVRQKISACFTVFVTDSEVDYSGGAQANQNVLPEKVGPGLIEMTPPGKSVDFASPPQLNDSNFVRDQIRAIATGTNVTYERLTGDFSQVTFSSARMGDMEFHRNVDQWRWFMMIPQACRPIFDWFMEAASLEGIKAEGLQVGWTPPRKEMIDVTAETNALVKQLRAGVVSLPEAIRERGNDFEAHLKEIQESNKKLDELEITLDSDPRKMSVVGFAQTPQALEALAGIEQPKPPASASDE